MIVDEPLNFFESHNDPLVTRRAPPNFLQFRELGKFFGQFVERRLTHSDPLS